MKQPLISAIEAGSRQASAATRVALDRSLAIRPSTALAARREQVRELFGRAGVPEPRVFGSVARGEDDESSDVDLLVEFTDAHDIVDLLTLEEDLEALLTVPVDVVDARARDGGAGSKISQFGADAAYTVGLGMEAYLDDRPRGRVLRNNGRHILVQIATIVEKLPADYKAAHPSVDWVAIGRMRNLIAHHYDKVDDRLVFAALGRRIPDLLERLGLDVAVGHDRNQDA